MGEFSGRLSWGLLANSMPKQLAKARRDLPIGELGLQSPCSVCNCFVSGLSLKVSVYKGYWFWIERVRYPKGNT